MSTNTSKEERKGHTMLCYTCEFPATIHETGPRDMLSVGYWDHAEVADVANALDGYKWMF
jgi:hypothetical protein